MPHLKQDRIEFKERRKKLIHLVQQQHGMHEGSGAIVLFAGFEHEHLRFRQESSFYYFTGVQEPGVVLVLDLEGTATLFIPNHGGNRTVWMSSGLEVTEESAHAAGVDKIEYLGQQCDGYQLYPFFSAQGHEKLLKVLGHALQKKQPLFTLKPQTAYGYVEQRFVLNRLNLFLPGIADAMTDISPLVARMRRVKSVSEIDCLFKAIEITVMAHEGAAQVIEAGKVESQVQAAIEYIFIEAGAQRPAFPTIVGSGSNSTVLHYNLNKDVMRNADVVVVDIGAEYENYCADLTRTYPVSGKFSPRQQELYNIVLDTQEYIADIAKPGYWLSNKEHPDKSLNHLAREFLKDRGYAQYFHHGIGHFLGLDVHDVGDPLEPLQDGDVITIEPGIYISEERIGIRIEDNYWIVKGAAVCLSEDLPKFPGDIEDMVNEKHGKTEKKTRHNDGYDA